MMLTLPFGFCGAEERAGCPLHRPAQAPAWGTAARPRAGSLLPAARGPAAAGLVWASEEMVMLVSGSGAQ